MNSFRPQNVACSCPSNWSGPISFRPAILLAALVILSGADLPDNVPIPQPRPDTASEPKVKNEVPAAKPEETKPKEYTQPKEETEVYVPPPIETEDPKLLQACLTELKAMGVDYKEIPRIDDGNGCGIDHPLVVTSLGQHIALKPEGKMRCEAALALTRWTRDIVMPMLKTASPDETLIGLDQASTYICRKRNSAQTGKISEHAHGNAVDIAGFRFKSGNAFSIKPRMKDSTMDGAFQRAIATAACLYFTTVLDPGSDKAHETHLHLDVIKRKAGYRYCW